MTITLPIPNRGLWPNSRGHWSKRGRLVKRARWIAKMKLLESMEYNPSISFTGYTLAFYWPDARRRLQILPRRHRRRPPRGRQHPPPRRRAYLCHRPHQPTPRNHTHTMNPMPIQPPLPSFTVPPEPTDIFMVDIETAGIESGSAILEIAAAEFNPSTGEILREWSNTIDVLDSARLGMTFEADTADFHLRKGYDGDLRGSTLWSALNALHVFLHLHAEKGIEVWAWGMDFEARHLSAAVSAASYVMPWKYYQARDARTVWELAFPGIKHPKRHHRAAEDVRAQIADLTAAMANIRRIA